MAHKPIHIKDVSLSFPHKDCFERFTARIQYGDRVAVIGRNGSGKSTFLKMLQGILEPSEGRRLLNDFLFRKNGEVNALVSTLSGGEKARLSLAQIAARTPRLLMPDEISNNLDLETREHAIQVLKAYPGAMIIISHDEDFLRQVNVSCHYEIKEGTLVPGYDY